MRKYNEPIRLLDHGYVQLIETWGSDKRVIEAARMSTSKGFKGWGTKKAPGDEKLLKYLWDNAHATPFEMAGMTIEVKAPIVVFREWHRHRTQSYNEMSARYAPMPNENYRPTPERVLMGNTATTNKQAQGSGRVMTLDEVLAWLIELDEFYVHAQAVYQHGLDLGVPKELARLAVPVARYSVMRASANLRNWLAFLKLRYSSKAQWEIHQYAKAVAGFVAARFRRTHEVSRGSFGV